MQLENHQLQTEMDIVNRLTFFMEAYGIGSTQFADACGIPRPTLSQILSGRNKKISDAVIAKIHNAYPNLSVLWLLFGEGSMESGAGVRSQAQKTEFQAPEIPDAQRRNDFVAAQTDDSEDMGGLFSGDSLFFGDEEGEKETAKSAAPGGEEPVVTIPADDSKSIVNIMVFYSDNSYQSFVPR